MKQRRIGRIIKVAFSSLLIVLSVQSVMAAEYAGHNQDYRTFHADGKIEYGDIGDSYNSDLVMYLAGNQFMVMAELINDFQSKYKNIETIYVETIPPGQILKGQLLKQGEIDRHTAGLAVFQPL